MEVSRLLQQPRVGRGLYYVKKGEKSRTVWGLVKRRTGLFAEFFQNHCQWAETRERRLQHIQTHEREQNNAQGREAEKAQGQSQ